MNRCIPCCPVLAGRRAPDCGIRKKRASSAWGECPRMYILRLTSQTPASALATGAPFRASRRRRMASLFKRR